MRISKLSGLAFHLNTAIDSGKCDCITVESVKDAIGRRDIFYYLQKNLGIESGGLTLLTVEDMEELSEEWISYLGIDEGRKFGIAKSGLCLLVSYLLESIQRRMFEFCYAGSANFEKEGRRVN